MVRKKHFNEFYFIIDFKILLEIESGNKWKKNPYIPLTNTPDVGDPFFEYNSMQILPVTPPVKILNPADPVNGDSKESERIGLSDVDSEKSDDNNFVRRKRWNEVNVRQQNVTNTTTDWKFIPKSNVVIFTKDEQIILPSASESVAQKQEDILNTLRDQTVQIPHFHVSYWMFYPFSQGKTICTLSLGPLGPIPIPLIPIWNLCLGTKRDFGSHVGDWEHFSLNFKGRMEPEVRVLRVILLFYYLT